MALARHHRHHLEMGDHIVDLRLPMPDVSGFADVAGVQIGWESFGDGESVVLVIPTWNFVDSRVSARLVPELSRSFRVVTYDPRGAGRSDRPPTGYRLEDHLADAVAVMEVAGVARPSLIAASAGTETAVLFAARLPDQVERVVLIDPPIQVEVDALEDVTDDGFWIERDSYEGWERWSAPYWRQDWPAFARWFLEQAFNEPESETLIDAVLSIALEADPEMLIQQHREQHRARDFLTVAENLGRISSPTLVVHGELDLSVPLALGRAVAAAIPGAVLAVVVAGCHRPDIRSPELINPMLVSFLRGQQLTSRPGIEIEQQVSRG